jgi:UDP-3-O-[3-hydroxymyristoyl] glucosamine N-acyltransferase
MEYSLKALAAQIDASIIGDGSVNVTGVASVTDAGGGDVVFAEDEENLAAALKSRAGAVIAGDFAQGAKTSKVILIVAHPRLAFARAARLLGRHVGQESGIHPSAVIHPSAKLGKEVSVAAKAVIGKALIGERSSIGAGCVIGDGVQLGEQCEIYPNVTIYPDSLLGNRVIVHAGAVLGSDGFGYVRDSKTGRHEKFPQIGRLEIEDDVEIGANTTIDRGALEVTRIGRRTKIDNLVHIGHNCQFGEDVIIAAQAGFSGSIIIENQVVIGGQVGVGEHARIQEGVLLGGQAGVLPKKILRGKGVAFWGTPAKPLREYLRSLASLARLGKKEQ